MQVWVAEWLPLMAVASLAGIINLINASTKFNRKVRSPFFNPWQSPGLWWWVLVQVSLPIGFVWFLFGPLFKPPLNIDFIFKAITVGLSFTAFTNANIDLGVVPFPLSDFYLALTHIAFRQIEASQRGKLAAFYSDLQQELSQNSSQFEAGLNYLKNYFKDDSSRKLEEERELLKQIEVAQAQTSQKDKIDLMISLLRDVRSKDYFDALKRFGCPDSFLRRYFPQQFAKANSPKP